MSKEFWQKESLIYVYQGLNTQPSNCHVNARPINQYYQNNTQLKHTIWHT